MKHKDHQYRLKKLTLSQRITWLTGGIVFMLGFTLIVFINSIAPIFVINSVGSPNTQILIETVDEKGNPITVIAETPSPNGYTIFQDKGILRSDPLAVVKVLSIIGLFIITTIGFLAAKWAATTSLKPVVEISKAAHEISAHTLNQRLNYQGAQDEIKNLADDFDFMLQRLQMNFKSQKEFICNLAHELRTPLTSLRMNLEVLNSDSQATLVDYHDFSINAEHSLSRLERLVEDLLLLAIGEKEFNLQNITLGVMFEEIIEELTPIADNKNVHLEISGDLELEIFGDPVLLYRAFSNLIENGIHYNRPNGFVVVSPKKQNDQVNIEIKDNGIGISEHQQAHIFERFYRCGSSGHHNNSKGLGLAITAHIIQLHNGKIEVESSLEEGSIFRIFLYTR